MSAAKAPWIDGLIDPIERLIKSHLAEAKGATAALAPLIGKVILLDFTPPGREIYLCPGPQEIQILTSLSGTPDLIIRGSPLTFLKAAMSLSEEAAIRHSGLTLEGDLQLARALTQLSQVLNIDWQRVLSRTLGERLAREALEGLRAGRHWLQKGASSLESDLGDYLREESRWCPDALEVERFLTAVDQLRDETERLEARLQRLESDAGRPA